MGEKPVAKRGAHRAAFDAAAALDALKWAQGGQQIELPGIGARRFVGIQPLPDDNAPRASGRPPGAVNMVPQAFREYLVAKYGSAVEGLAHFAGRPVVSIVAEMVEAHRTVCAALGVRQDLTKAEILELVRMVPGLQLQARRYAAPYQHTAAPQPVAAPPPVHRIGVAMFTNGTPTSAQAKAAGGLLAAMLESPENQPFGDGPTLELDAIKLDGSEGDDG
jgi:hypothetical protein